MCNRLSNSSVFRKINKICHCISFHFDYFTHLSPCIFINLSTAAGTYRLWKQFSWYQRCSLHYSVLTLWSLLVEIYVYPQLPKYWRCHGEHEAEREGFVFTYNFFFFSEVSHSQSRDLPVNHSVLEKFYCHRTSLEIFRLVSRLHLSRWSLTYSINLDCWL